MGTGSCQPAAYFKDLHLRASTGHPSQPHPHLQHRPSGPHVQRAPREGSPLLPPRMAQCHPPGKQPSHVSLPILLHHSLPTLCPGRSVSAMLLSAGPRSTSSTSQTCAWRAIPLTPGWTWWRRAAPTCRPTRSPGTPARPSSPSAFTADASTMTLIRCGTERNSAACLLQYLPHRNCCSLVLS